MISRPFILVCAASLAGSMSVAAATAPGINPTADAFVGSANPGNNYGAAGALEVSAPGSTKGEFDSFVRFNLGSTKAYFDGLYGANHWTVQSITLQLTTSAPNNALFNASAAGMFSIQLNNSDAWVEGTGTPSTADTTATDLNYNNHASYVSASDPVLGMYSFAGGTSGTGTYTLDLSIGLLTDVQTGSDASLYVSAADTQVSYLFNSTNFTSSSARPVLVVSAMGVPEPGPTTIFLIAAGTLLASHILRRAQRPA